MTAETRVEYRSLQRPRLLFALFCIALVVARIVADVRFDLNSVYLIAIAALVILIDFQSLLDRIKSLKAPGGVEIELEEKVNRLEAIS